MAQMFLLAALPPEVINFHLVQYLDSQSIIRLFSCIDVEPTEGVYQRAFYDNTHYKEYNLKMFRERARAKVYIVGDTYDEALGTASYDQTENEIITAKDGITKLRRSVSPNEVSVVEDSVVKVCTEGKRLRILTSAGEIFVTGEPAAVEKNTYQFFSKRYIFTDTTEDTSKKLVKVRAREQVTDILEKVADAINGGSYRSSTKSSRTVSIESFVRDKAFAPTHFVDMDSAEGILLAADDLGLLWKWNASLKSVQGVPFVLCDEKAHSPVLGKITMVRASAKMQTCFVEGKGIYYWIDQEAPPLLWRQGFPSAGENFLSMTANLVPGTKDRIHEYIVAGWMLVYLKSNGTISACHLLGLYKTRNIPDATYAQSLVNLSSVNDIGAENGGFVQLTGSKDGFELMCKNGTIYLATVVFEPNNSVRILLDSASMKDVATVSKETHHTVVLSQDGSVASWGLEVNFNGCFGQGTQEEAEKFAGVQRANDSLVAVKTNPVKMALPGKVYGVFAGQGFTAVLMFRE